MSDRWLKVGTGLGVIACVAFAIACGGGGGGGDGVPGGGGTKVAMTLSFPAVAVGKPGSPDGGAIRKTMVTEATVTLTTAAGLEYSMTEADAKNDPGVYTGTIPGLSEGDALIIEARKGTLELSKLIPEVVILGDGTTYDAGDVDTVSTAFTEIVKEIAEKLSLTADVSAGGDLITNLDTITTQIDLTQLYTEIVTALVDTLYDLILAEIEEACVTGYNASLLDATITEASTLTDGTLVREDVFGSLPIIITDYPETSPGATYALAAGQAFLDALLAMDATALSASLASTTLWDGATKEEVVEAWELDFARMASGGIATRTFGGTFLSEETSPGSGVYKIGLRGSFEDLNSSGTVINWMYMDAFRLDKYWTYAKKISSGVWKVTGNGLKQTVKVTYLCKVYYDSGTSAGPTPSSESRALCAWAEQATTITTPAYLITSGTVSGGPISSCVLEVGDDPSEWGGWHEWQGKYPLGPSDPDPEVGVEYTFNLAYDASPIATTTVLMPFTPLADLSMMRLDTLTVTPSSITVEWTAPALDDEISQIWVEICGCADDLDKKFVVPGTTSSVTLSTTGMTSGEHYTIRIEYLDVYINQYEIEKEFLFSP